MTPLPATCPMFDTPNCRFFSQESILIPFTKLIENPKTNRLEPAKETMLRKEPMGAFCNNVSMWVSDLKLCPARWALHGVASSGCIADGTGVYVEPVAVPSVLFRED